MARWYPKPKRWAGAIVKRTVQLSPDPGLGGLWPCLDCVAISWYQTGMDLPPSLNHCSDMPENENKYTNVRLLHRSAQSEIERKWFLMVLVVVRYLCLCVHPNIPAASRSCTRTTPISEKDLPVCFFFVRRLWLGTAVVAHGRSCTHLQQTRKLDNWPATGNGSMPRLNLPSIAIVNSMIPMSTFHPSACTTLLGS